MAVRAGFEPAATRLTAERSTAELPDKSERASVPAEALSGQIPLDADLDHEALAIAAIDPLLDSHGFYPGDHVRDGKQIQKLLQEVYFASASMRLRAPIFRLAES